MQISEGAKGLMQQMLQKPLYVVLRTPHDLTRFSDLLEEHLQWAIAAEKRGELFASGPFLDGGTPGAAGGMSILRAGSEAEAQRILSADPFIREKVYMPFIKKWMLMEGGVTVTVRFSDQSCLVR
jgi:uncharacterized protein YciI